MARPQPPQPSDRDKAPWTWPGTQASGNQFITGSSHIFLGNNSTVNFFGAPPCPTPAWNSAQVPPSTATIPTQLPSIDNTSSITLASLASSGIYGPSTNSAMKSTSGFSNGMSKPCMLAFQPYKRPKEEHQARRGNVNNKPLCSDFSSKCCPPSPNYRYATHVDHTCPVCRSDGVKDGRF